MFTTKWPHLQLKKKEIIRLLTGRPVHRKKNTRIMPGPSHLPLPLVSSLSSFKLIPMSMVSSRRCRLNGRHMSVLHSLLHLRHTKENAVRHSTLSHILAKLCLYVRRTYQCAPIHVTVWICWVYMCMYLSFCIYMYAYRCMCNISTYICTCIYI
jgi:hypothetical protein